MAEYTTVMREYNRMCKGNTKCENCPIALENNGGGIECQLFLHKYPGATERIIMQWASEHPAMTNGEKFEQVFGFTPYKGFRSYEDMKQWVESEYERNN